MAICRRAHAVIVAGVLASACTPDDLTLPIAASSEWGGFQVSARLTPDSVRFVFACSNVRSSGPLRVNVAGRFAVTGLLRQSVVHDEAPVTLRGTLRGDTLHLEQLTGTGRDPQVLRYTAIRGIAGDFSGYYCIG